MRRQPLGNLVAPVLVLSLATATAPPAVGQEGETRSPDEGGLLPVGLIYDPYLADPDRPGSAVLWKSVVDEAIADSGTTRFDLKVGGAFGLWRWGAEREAPRWQLDLLAGIDALFDIDEGYDNIGWDGNYGLAVSTSRGARWGFRAGVLHTSSHIGDELIERTGRERIDYTREETLVGARLEASARWVVYGEVAYGHELRNEELQEPWRLQTGVEYEILELFMHGRAGFYTAVDLRSWEERDHRLDVTVHVGVSVPSGARRWRMGLELQDGRPNLGEFFQVSERVVGLGVWLEL
jgi:hypothetical protein